MQPATYDFDVITDAPAPTRRAPEPAEPAPQADAEEERRQPTEAFSQQPRARVQAAQ
jgi:hypothetical protein